MSTFFSQLSQIETSPSDPSWPQNNPNATPTPPDVAAALRLLQEQFTVLAQNTTDDIVIDRLASLNQELELLVEHPPTKVAGVPQSYLDELERVPKKELKKTDDCPICGECFLDDPYPLVVQLPCHPKHRFDLDCVGPWLRMNGTCPLDRKDLMKKKEVPKPDKEEEEEDYDEMFA